MTKLVVDNVTKQYATRSEPVVVLRGISLSIEQGETVAILGPSGSGKSTLLHILGTLETPSSGTVSLGGVNPFTLDEPALAAFRNQHIGFVFQEHHLLPQLSVLENVLIPALAAGQPTTVQRDRAIGLLERVGLSHRLEHRPAELSGGERQRVAIARALLLQPRLLLADEPTGNLDRTNAQAIARVLGELRESEPTMLVVVTHSQELAELMQRRYHIDDGRLEAAR